MTERAGWLERAIDQLNRSRLWHARCSVWGQRMHSATFERWLYLRLHRLGWMGKAEQRTLRYWIQPGMTVLDIGANLGLYSILISRLVGENGRVFSFEPDPDLFALLQTSARANERKNITARAIALGEHAAEITLHRGIFNSGDNYLGEQGKRAFRRVVQIPVAALDELEPALKVDFIKLDVQGWELPVLRGMKAVLQGNPAAVLQVEFWPAGCRRAGYEPAALIGFLRELGFELSLADKPLELLSDAQLRELEQRLTGISHSDLIVRRGAR